MASVLKRRKIYKRLLAALLIIVLLICSGLLGMFIHESNLIKNAPDTLAGTVPLYEWSQYDTFDIERYPVLRTQDGSVKVLQLTDLHWRNRGTFGAMVGMNYIMDGYLKRQVRMLVEAESPDLIVITGDLITYTAADVAYREIVAFFDEFKIPWTVTFGNHDGEYNLDKAALSEILMEGEYCLFDPGPTTLGGLGHHVIVVRDNADNLSQALIMMDTNDEVAKSEYPDRAFAAKETGIFSEQANWYGWVTEGLTAEHGGDAPPITSVYYHIKSLGVANAPTLFLLEIERRQSTRFIFYGHTHAAGSTSYDRDYQIYFTNGVKAGINYKEDPMTGGTVSVVRPDGSGVIRHLHVSFNEITEESKTVVPRRIIIVED